MRRVPIAHLLIAIVIGSLVCTPGWGFERDKSDVVTLRNGDRVTGDIISLRQGILTVKTKSMGTLSVEWPAVRSISSKFAFAVERIGGLNFYGLVNTTEDGSELKITTADKVASIPIAEVERISQFSPSFWKRLNGDVAAGFSYTKSSAISVGSVYLDTRYRSTAIDASVEFSFNSTRSPSEGVTDRYLLSSNVMFLRQSRNFWSLVGSLEREQALGVDARLAAGPALGRSFIQSAYTEVIGVAGLVGNQEWITGSSQPRSSLEGLLGTDWRVFKFIEPKTTLDLTVAIFPSLTQSHRYRGTGNVSLTHKLVGGLTVGATGYWSYDSRPPQGAVEKSDYGVTFNLGYSYGE
jgi:uncharacterized protein DUF481